MRVGDYCEVTHSSRLRIPAGRHFCMYALQAVLPLLPAKQRDLPAGDWLEKDSLVCCPDPGAPRHADRTNRSAADARGGPDLMERIRFGVGLQSDKRGPDYARLGAHAETCGFDVVSVFSDLLYQPPIYPLLEIARATSTIRLGAACWNPCTLHPYEIAGQVAVLDQACGGRAYLGLSRGTWLGSIGVQQARPITRLREALQVITRLLQGDTGRFDGEIFTVEAGTRLRYDLPAQQPPILVGTWGPRAARVAGRLADEVKVGGTANPAMVSLMRRWVANAATDAGRATDTTGVCAGAVTVVDEDRAAARVDAQASPAALRSPR